MTYAIGIDLGTTNTVVAAVVDGVAVTLEDEQRRRLLPSVVSFHPSGTVLVGDQARDRLLIDPENTIFSVKPLIGRAFGSDEVVAARGRFPFQLVEGAKNGTMVHARDVDYALPEISAFVLRRAKAIAEHALGAPVDRAVITVPANFNDLQRASTKIAGKLAGLEILRILNEPTAAALAYGQSIAKAEKIAVYDLGGGTFDVTLLDLTGSVFEVLATAGDTALGGDDIDRLIAERLALEVARKTGFDPRADGATFARLRFIAEDLKKQLSTDTRAERELRDLAYGPGGVPISTQVALTRAELEQIAQPLVDRTIDVARQTVEVVGLHPRDFDRVLLVGGSTRMPFVARRVEAMFGQPPHLKVNPDEVVALGAAIQAHALNRSKPAAKPPPLGPRGRPDVPPAPGVPTGPGMTPEAPPQYLEFTRPQPVLTFSPPPPPPGPPGTAPMAPPLRPQAPPVPPQRMQTAPFGTDPSAPALPPMRPPAATLLGPGAPPPPSHDVPPNAGADAPSFNFDLGDAPSRSSGPPLGELGGGFFPDFGPEVASPPIELETFARGSAIETAKGAPLLIDVTPLSLRVETVGGYADVLIAANSPVPCEKARTFLTASDNQTVVFIRVAQGESSRFAENTYLGELELSGLKPTTRGEVKILVTFELDADGILNVRAKDKDTNRETKATMRLLGTGDAEDVSAMAARQARHVVA